MEEQNKKTLIEALSSLPEYEPSETAWENIEAAMAETVLPIPREAILALPEHDPPAQIWELINQQLGNTPIEKGRLVRLEWRKALAIAATIAIVVSCWFLYKKQTPANEDFAISYSTENLDPLLAVQDWDEDEEAFREFLHICEAKKYICEQPAFQQLQSELEELTEAKEALKEAVGNYGADVHLITQIKEIELERTGLLKKMMVMLI